MSPPSSPCSSPSSPRNVWANVRPDALLSTTCRPIFRETGAEKLTLMGSMGRQGPFGASRSQVNVSRKGGRVRNGSSCEELVGTPVSERMPSPHVSWMSASAGKRCFA